MDDAISNLDFVVDTTHNTFPTKMRASVVWFFGLLVLGDARSFGQTLFGVARGGGGGDETEEDRTEEDEALFADAVQEEIEMPPPEEDEIPREPLFESAPAEDEMDFADDEAGETTPGSFEVETTVADPVELDEATVKGLRKLGYKKREISHLRPEIAVIAVQKSLHRPVEGVPPNWFATPLPEISRARKIAQKVMVTVALGAMAVHAGLQMQLGTGLVASVSSLMASNKVTLPEPVADVLFDDEPVVAADPDEMMDAEEGDEDAHPHSVKPGEIPHDDPDASRLDKILSGIESKIKALLNMKI